MSPLISVVIPTYGRPDSLAHCLEALAEQTIGRDRFQVVVVDDGSPTDIRPTVESYSSNLQLELVEQENAGPAAARNHGVEVASGEFVAFTDDDCIPRPNWLEALHQRLTTEVQPCLVGGRVTNLLSENHFSETSQLILEMVYAHYNSDPDHAKFFASMNLALSKRDLLAIGGFNPAFRTSEDRELCHRWRHAGHRLVYEPNAEIGHARALGIRTFLRQHFNYGRGASNYRQACKEYGKESTLSEGDFHLALPGLARRHLRGRRFTTKTKLMAILCMWQLSNTAGFFKEQWS
jgi:GT2 family glycosyltransferase